MNEEVINEVMKIGDTYLVNGHEVELCCIHYGTTFREDYYYFSDGLFIRESELAGYVSKKS